MVRKPEQAVKRGLRSPNGIPYHCAMLSPTEALSRAIDLVGGPSEAGRCLGVTRQCVIGWKKTRIPAERVLDLERLTLDAGDVITRHELRPDVFGESKVRTATS